jgi:hypothetical protein
VEQKPIELMENKEAKRSKEGIPLFQHLLRKKSRENSTP